MAFCLLSVCRSVSVCLLLLRLACVCACVCAYELKKLKQINFVKCIQYFHKVCFLFSVIAMLIVWLHPHTNNLIVLLYLVCLLIVVYLPIKLKLRCCWVPYCYPVRLTLGRPEYPQQNTSPVLLVSWHCWRRISTRDTCLTFVLPSEKYLLLCLPYWFVSVCVFIYFFCVYASFLLVISQTLYTKFIY